MISPEQAVWLPAGLPHRVGSLLGAEFRRRWIAEEAGAGLPGKATVFGVSPLLQALIVEAAEIEGRAVELLGGGLSVTRTAMELGYGSTSAFVYAFRTDMGCSPQVYVHRRLGSRGVRARLPGNRRVS